MLTRSHGHGILTASSLLMIGIAASFVAVLSWTSLPAVSSLIYSSDLSVNVACVKEMWRSLCDTETLDSIAQLLESAALVSFVLASIAFGLSVLSFRLSRGREVALGYQLLRWGSLSVATIVLVVSIRLLMMHGSYVIA